MTVPRWETMMTEKGPPGTDGDINPSGSKNTRLGLWATYTPNSLNPEPTVHGTHGLWAEPDAVLYKSTI